MALIDTNILIRAEDKDSPHRLDCIEALRLLQQEDQAHICAQVLIEFWAVVTRSTAANGLNFDHHRAAIATRKLIEALTLLPEPPDMAVRWINLAHGVGVVGKQVHDTRLVALMLAHGINEIVTLNGADFQRYRSIKVIHPRDVGDFILGRS